MVDENNVVNGKELNELRVSLKEYFERLLAEHEKSNDAKFKAIEEARIAAFKNNESRLDILNEWKDTFRNLSSLYVTSDKIDSIINQIAKDNINFQVQISELKQSIAVIVESMPIIQGKQVYFDERIKSLEIKQSNTEGRFAAYAAAFSIGIVILTFVLKLLPI